MTAATSRGRRSDAQGHVGFLRHGGYRWAWISVLISAAAIAGYVTIDVQPRPNGGSPYGYVLGTIGALLIVWLTLLGLRKRAITAGDWSLKAWVSAHVYLGLSLVVITTLHTGFQFGWNVHTLTYALMLIVVVSGLYGVTAYSILPRRLSANRGETTQKQMIQAIEALDRQLDAAAQPLNGDQAVMVRLSLDHSRIGGSFIRRLRARPSDCGTRRALARLPALSTTATEPERAALDTVDGLLDRKTVALGQLRRHLRTRTLLNVWLGVHVPTTLALLMALTAHIVSVFIYW